MLGFSVRHELTLCKRNTPMNIHKKLTPLVVGLSILFIYSGCAKKRVAFLEQVSDGYIFAANEELLKDIQDNSDYGITLIDLGKEKPDRDTLKKALADPSKHSTVEGKATKLGDNRLKITTSSKVTVDVRQPFATFWGLNSKKIDDFLAGGSAAGNCQCYGVDDFKEVTCTDPNSVICCKSGC
jgi:hypothetical protein